MSNTHLEFLARQAVFARGAFGPGERRNGVPAHIRKELDEIAACETAEERATEWVDVVLLAQDGLLRSVREALREQLVEHKDKPMVFIGTKCVARFGEPTTDYVAMFALELLTGKRDKNELRDWPNWREASEDNPIEHVKGTHD
ncbi:hypothetical protein Pan1_58 [Pseudanabaena phage Pan1]|nr:hypothetical protein Pan1_58 [Pseudanabaena phage Pan1]